MAAAAACVFLLSLLAVHAAADQHALDARARYTGEIVCKPGQVGKPCEEYYPCPLTCNGKRVQPDPLCHKIGVCTGVGQGPMCTWGPTSVAPKCQGDAPATPPSGGSGGSGGGGSQSASPAAPVTPGAGSWSILPFQGSFGISQFYGDTKFARDNAGSYYSATQGMHNGVDFDLPCDTPVISVCDGVVVHQGAGGPFAAGPNSIIVRCDSGHYALYGHTSDFVQAKKGDKVSASTPLGKSWSDKFPAKSNCHLHFEVRPVPDSGKSSASAVNPGYCINPIPVFADKLRSYFQGQLGNAGPFCTGDMLTQPQIRFGGPLQTGPCK